MSILYLIPIWFFLALLIPTIWSMSKAYKRTWGRRIVICPETNRWANIQLDARHAIRMHVLGNPARQIQSCSRWPERQRCSRGCLAQVLPLVGVD